MNRELVFQIAGLVLSLIQSHQKGIVQRDAAVGNILLQLVRKGAEAYTQHMGEPIDPTLIKPEEAV